MVVLATRLRIVIHFIPSFKILSWLANIDSTAQKMKFSVKNFFSKCDQIFFAVSSTIKRQFITQYGLVLWVITKKTELFGSV